MEKSSDLCDLEEGLAEIAECRICQDNDFITKLEVPCSCSGTLKFAHRDCIQKWCNEKKDTICEICRQPFSPGYTARRPCTTSRSSYEGTPSGIRSSRTVPGTVREVERRPALETDAAADRSQLYHEDPNNGPITAATWRKNCIFWSAVYVLLVAAELGGLMYLKSRVHSHRIFSEPPYPSPYPYPYPYPYPCFRCFW